MPPSIEAAIATPASARVGSALLARPLEGLTERERRASRPERHLSVGMDPDRFLGRFDRRGIVTVGGQDECARSDHLPDRGRNISTTRSTFDRIEEPPGFVVAAQAQECLCLIGDESLPADRHQPGSAGL
jgi:hypothetical protein